MISTVFSDVKYFIVVYFVLAFAFSDAFYAESNALPKEERYVDSFFDAFTFTYSINIAGFD